jgi:protein-L-isoaspartate(D-aspartate) O-methyltransferase
MTYRSRHPAILAGLLLFGLLMIFHAPGSPAREFAELRASLVREIRRHVSDTRMYTGRRSLDERVMEVIGRVPRHEYVPLDRQSQAYQNRPLPIGHGQTISQPYIVALMTDMLEPQPGDTVLEIGTGSGYQAAVLAELVGQVHTIEIIEPLSEQASIRLRKLGYDNIETSLGDGYYGWPEHAPFDAIIVTAAASHIPPPLIKQIKPGGVMLIPVGPQFSVQQLTLVEKRADGSVTTRQVLPVRFVPLTGRH